MNADGASSRSRRIRLGLILLWAAGLLTYACYAKNGALQGKLATDELSESPLADLPMRHLGGSGVESNKASGVVFISRYCEVCKRRAGAIVRAAAALGPNPVYFVLVRETEMTPLAGYPTERLVVLVDETGSWGRKISHVPTFVLNSDGEMERIWTGVPNRLQAATFRLRRRMDQ